MPRTTCSRRRLLASGAALALLGPAACGRPSTTRVTRPFQLAISDGSPARRYLPLDPVTLADRPNEPALPVGASSWALSDAWTLSADGSTVVEIDQATPTMVVVRDGRTFSERTRFTLPAPIIGFPLRLSADGRRLVVQRNPGNPPRPDTWDVLDTASGRLVATVRASTRSNHWEWWIDAPAEHLYVPELTVGIDNPAPQPLRLAAYDLRSGATVGKLTLADVPSGTWADGRVINGDPVMHQQYPALAQTPDFQRLAIFAPERAALTVIDLPGLRVAQRHTVAAPPTLAGALAALLPFWPQRAEAKAMEGPWLNGVVGPDARSFYVWGTVSAVDAGGHVSTHPFGLQRLDLTHGSIAATALVRAELFAVEPGLDGRALYVYGRDAGTPVTSPDWPGVLWRLDAITLVVTAERQFTGYRTLLLRPI